VKLTYLSVYDIRDGVPVVPLLTHECTQVHRFSKHNPTDTVYFCETEQSYS
jgi:hypothetical protein